MPGKSKVLYAFVDPISPPSDAASRIAAACGGGAGYRPRVRSAYYDRVYHHSWQSQHHEYSRQLPQKKAFRRLLPKVSEKPVTAWSRLGGPLCGPLLLADRFFAGSG